MENEERKSVQDGSASGRKDYFLPISILLAALLIGGSLVYSAGKKSAVPIDQSDNLGNKIVEKPNLDNVVWLGNSSAPISVVEYADFQCPVCGSFFSEVLPSLKKDYIDTGKIRFAYLDFVFLGPESLLAAQAVHCASDQNKFWELHNLLHQAEIVDGQENNKNISAAFLSTLAKQVGLNTTSFDSCLSQEKYKNKVLEVTAQGQRAGVRATPTFFVNDQKLEGLDPGDPYGKIKLIIDSELNKVGR